MSVLSLYLLMKVCVLWYWFLYPSYVFMSHWILYSRLLLFLVSYFECIAGQEIRKYWGGLFVRRNLLRV